MIRFHNIVGAYHDRIPGPVQSLRRFNAVKPLTLTVRRGEVFGFLGPNGAGKTTTIRMMMGILVPSAGRC
jgi:ABC-type multidrug transport system ATPase subunit